MQTSLASHVCAGHVFLAFTDENMCNSDNTLNGSGAKEMVARYVKEVILSREPTEVVNAMSIRVVDGEGTRWADGKRLNQWPNKPTGGWKDASLIA